MREICDIIEERPLQPRSHKDIGEWNLQTVIDKAEEMSLQSLYNRDCQA